MCLLKSANHAQGRHGLRGPQGLGLGDLAWILPNKKHWGQLWHADDVAASVEALPAKNWPWRAALGRRWERRMSMFTVLDTNFSIVQYSSRGALNNSFRTSHLTPIIIIVFGVSIGTRFQVLWCGQKWIVYIQTDVALELSRGHKQQHMLPKYGTFLSNPQPCCRVHS